MKKPVLVLVGIVACIAVVWWLYGALASDTTKIRWLIEGMAESFNDMSSGGTVKGLSEEFEEETSGATKPEVRTFLVYIFLKERDEETKDFLYRVELDPPRIDVKGEKADVSLDARFFRKRGEGWKSIWVVGIEAKLRKEDAGWRIHRSSHETREGRPPF
jgi:hypothetical protein